jgi:ATP-dependent DNA ligase
MPSFEGLPHQSAIVRSSLSRQNRPWPGGGIVSKRADAAYSPGNRGLWLKVKCLDREAFVVIGWTDPEGSRPFLGALLLGYYDPDGRLTYAGRVGTGINQAELARLWRRLQPLARFAVVIRLRVGENGPRGLKACDNAYVY